MTTTRKILSLVLLTTNVVCAAESAASAQNLTPTASKPQFIQSFGQFGTIRGTVRDDSGAPVANAVIALLRDGSSLVKQIRSQSNGDFVARVVPGRYSLTAFAEGFTVASLSNVDVSQAEDIAYRFNLIRTNSGNTLPERRADRRNPKWRARANQQNRSIYQNNEGTDEAAAIEETIADNNERDNDFSTRPQAFVETFAGNYAGTNFAVAQPVRKNVDLIFAGQTGFGTNAPQRFQTTAAIKLNDSHELNLKAGAGKLGQVRFGEQPNLELGQVSFSAIDQWRVKNNIVVVVGLDYARFVGASDAASFAPRFGLQFDADSKTRLRAAYTVAQNQQRGWTQAVELENNRVLFREPDFEPYAVVDKPSGKQILQPRLRRLEFGVERVLDGRSNVDAAAFFDLANNRGLSFVALPITAFNDETGDNAVSALQNGTAQGFRVVYSRRLNQIFNASAGYSAGRGQRLSADAVTNPANLLVDDFFQTVAAQFSADFDSGTRVQTVYRYSPRAAVFAIDPFAGQMTTYEPSISVLVTQNLPTCGLPIRAKAIFDARNLLDWQSSVADGNTTLQLNQMRRTLRGGIAVSF